MVRAKTSLKETKHTQKRATVITKVTSRTRKRQKLEKMEISDDPQADKENNMPTPVSRKSTFIKSGSKHKRRNIKNSYEKSLKENNTDEEKYEKSTVKRVSLKKKADTTLVESGSKVSVNGSNKENSECIKTPTSSDLPRNTYGLRRRGRGRQPKKSHIYKSEENLIFSHEKDEEMNKYDDSEFKLPNEDKSKLI